MTYAVEVERLSFSYGRRPALHDVSFRIGEGESVGLAGANGSGKSTLLWCLLGLVRATGDVRIFGEKPGRKTYGKLGAVFQNPEDQLFMPSILDDLTLGLRNRGRSMETATRKAMDALSAVGLAKHAELPASSLSMGQRKRASIALAMSASPELLLLDEPTAELDPRAVRQLGPRAVRQLGDLLSGLRVSKLVASHHLDFLRRVTTRLVILDEGAMVADGPIGDVLADLALLERVGLV
jgi:cobalt/nickel transport system ATP-binding protein